MMLMIIVILALLGRLDAEKLKEPGYTCTAGSYDTGTGCAACPPLCTECTSLTSCQACSDNSKLKNNNLCSCKTGYFPSLTGCSLCTSLCSQCISLTNCDGCIDDSDKVISECFFDVIYHQDPPPTGVAQVVYQN